MKKKIYLLLILSLIVISCATSTKKEDAANQVDNRTEASDTKQLYRGPYIIFGEDWAFRLYSFKHWKFFWEDAYKYKANAYYTENGESFNDSDSIVSFYFIKDADISLKDYVQQDVEYYYKEFSGIKISEFEFNYNASDYADKYPVNEAGKSYIGVKYDFSDVEGKHIEKYHYVVFFRTSQDSPYICIFQLASISDKAKTQLEDLYLMYISSNYVDKDTLKVK